jgi:hypothetical protein
MKHAGPAALQQIEPLLVQVRAFGGLVERKPGVFYLRSRAFLHFHEDPSGVFADLRVSDAFQRINVSKQDGHGTLIQCIRTALLRAK